MKLIASIVGHAHELEDSVVSECLICRRPTPVLLFHYPTTQPPALDYLKRSVKLEVGSLTDQRPTASHAVRPWIADVLPEAIRDSQCDVVALDLHRSFWEKATIPHAEHHRPLDEVMPDRFARHYADTAALAIHPDASGAIAQLSLCQRVVRWKSRFFGSAWARCDLAVPPTFKLVPPPEREAALRRDCQAMRDMYLSEPVPFDDALSTLADAERQAMSLDRLAAMAGGLLATSDRAAAQLVAGGDSHAFVIDGT